MPTSNETLKTSIERLVEYNQVEDGIRILIQTLSANANSKIASSERFSQLRNELTVLMGQHRKDIRNKRLGFVTSEQTNSNEVKLAHATLEYANEIEEMLSRANSFWPAKAPILDELNSGITSIPSFSISLEKVWGRNNLRNIAWLQQGLNRSRSVARISGPQGLGTGFLIGKNLLMTNNHVIANPKNAKAATVEFNYQEDEFGCIQSVFRYKVDSTVFVTDNNLDCTIVKIEDVDNSPLEQWGFIDTKLTSAVKFELGDPVSIIQHPQGGVKKICVTGNEILNVYEEYLQYRTDTEPGSSGSPVFDENWNVIALHHAGGSMRKDAEGNKHCTNQGVLIRSIITSDKFSHIFNSLL